MVQMYCFTHNTWGKFMCGPKPGNGVCRKECCAINWTLGEHKAHIQRYMNGSNVNLYFATVVQMKQCHYFHYLNAFI